MAIPIIALGPDHGHTNKSSTKYQPMLLIGIGPASVSNAILDFLVGDGGKMIIFETVIVISRRHAANSAIHCKPVVYNALGTCV
jgi:hypothetical protein